MNLEIDEAEREILVVGLSRLMGSQSSLGESQHDVFELIKRVAALQPEPDVGTVDYSCPGVVMCNACGAHALTAEFAHRPGCAWVRRYG